MNTTTTKTIDFSNYLEDTIPTSQFQNYSRYDDEPLAPLLDDGKEKSTLEQSIHDCIQTALFDEDDDLLSEHLNDLFLHQKEIYNSIGIDPRLRTRSFITPIGVAISPDYCIHTIKDTLRLKPFIRGVHFALQDLKKSFPNEPLHIVYPACGPFAPLLLPILAYYKNQKTYGDNEIQVTLIDIQAGAIFALKELVKELNIESYIRDIVQINAVEYLPKKDEPIHMVILESMQHGFTKEGHMAITRHFAKLLEPDGIFLPKNVSVRAYLTIPQEEYCNQWEDKSKRVRQSSISEEYRAKRTELGEILSLNKENIINLKEIPSNKPDVKLLVCSTLKIPEPKTQRDKQMLLIHTHIDVYNGEIIGEYDSGISHPLVDFRVCINFIPRDKRPDDIYLNSGDLITFYYRIDGLPGFLPFKRENLGEHNETKKL